MIIMEKMPYGLENTAVCIGKFDGLHSGHKVLIDAIKRYEDRKKVLFTFSFPEAEHIYSREEKRYLAEKMGIDIYIECPFDEHLSRMSPEQFIKQILMEECGASVIAVGEDFQFGYQRSGDAELLKKYSYTYGYDLEVFPKKQLYGEVVSSTRIRKELKNGTIETVNRLLGHNYFILGEVCHGNQIGRTLNMPTANQNLSEHKILPSFGVYASRIHMGKQVYTGVTNLGIKPTIPGKNKAGAETYIMNFNSDLYGKEICVELCAFLRGEQKFSGLDALKRQMEDDKRNADLFFRQ